MHRATSGSFSQSSLDFTSELKIDIVRFMSSTPTGCSCLYAWMYESTMLPMVFRVPFALACLSVCPGRPLQGIADELGALRGEPVVRIAILLSDLLEQVAFTICFATLRVSGLPTRACPCGPRGTSGTLRGSWRRHLFALGGLDQLLHLLFWLVSQERRQIGYA